MCPDASSPGRESLISTAVPAFWPRLAADVAGFAEQHGLLARDLVVLLPFAQHLPLARAAWTQRGSMQWMPRFETTQTLARGLAPPPDAPAGALSFDAVADRLQAAALLERQAPDWPRRDARGFTLAAAHVAETAQALARARLALPPARRTGWLAQARALLAPLHGPGAEERALARLALEWSDSADSTREDALFALAPAGWVAVRAGAADPLAEALLDATAAPVLRVDADASLQALLHDSGADLRVAACRDFEDEAQRSAAQVLAHLVRNEVPVALIALDRVLVRRVRALLERAGLPLADETGWKLSTTRAGASVVGLLRAVQPRAGTDALLDWLKSTPRAPDAPWPGLDGLEATWRRSAVSALARVDAGRLEGEAQALWQLWSRCSEPLRVTRRLPLADWLARLREALERAALWEPLAADAAGAQVLDALRCRGGEAGATWPQAVLAAPLDAPGFLQWVDTVLEQVVYAPPLPPGDAPVVITPLPRAMLRPFAAVVCPGADAGHLGAWPAPQPLLGDALATALGLPGAAARREAEARSFAQLLRAPRLTLLHRLHEGSEPLQPSPLLLRLRLAAERLGRALPEAADPRPPHTVAPQPVLRPAPTAVPALLATRIDASSYEDLRACPYRWYARRLLGLAEADELDDAVDKADYGRWLHAVLEAFHAQRSGGRDREADARLLTAVAEVQLARLGRDDADFLPYAAWFEQCLAPRYLDWLHAQEAHGATVRETEATLEARPAVLDALGVAMKGRLDRIDALRGAPGGALRIVDYKTTGSASLRERLRVPLEDTQLAFYAALLAGARERPTGGVEAAYLALDGKDAVQLLVHPEVEASAATLLEGLADDLARLQAGTPLPALGEGRACEHCSVRGLCRRDHWADAA